MRESCGSPDTEGGSTETKQEDGVKYELRGALNLKVP